MPQEPLSLRDLLSEDSLSRNKNWIREMSSQVDAESARADQEAMDSVADRRYFKPGGIVESVYPVAKKALMAANPLVGMAADALTARTANEQANYVRQGTRAARGGLMGGIEGIAGAGEAILSHEDAIRSEILGKLGLPAEYHPSNAPARGVLRGIRQDFGGASADLAENSKVLNAFRQPGDEPSFVDTVGAGVGPAVMSSIPGMALGGGASAVTARGAVALGLGEKAVPVLARLAGSGAEALTEAGSSYGEVYDKAIQAGKTDQEADQLARTAALKVGAANLVYLGLKNELGGRFGFDPEARVYGEMAQNAIGKARDAFLKKLGDSKVMKALGILGEGAMEYVSEGHLEEQVQKAFSNMAEKGLPFTWENFKQEYLTREAWLEGVTGGISGLLMGAGNKVLEARAGGPQGIAPAPPTPPSVTGAQATTPVGAMPPSQTAPAQGITQAPAAAASPAQAPALRDDQTGVFFDPANGRFMVEDASGARDLNPQNPAELQAASRLSQQAQLSAPLPTDLDGHKTQIKDIDQRLKLADAELEGEIDAEIARQQGAESLSKDQRRALALRTLQGRPEIAAKIQALQEGTATLKARKERLVHGIIQAPLATGLEQTDTSTSGGPDAGQAGNQEQAAPQREGSGSGSVQAGPVHPEAGGVRPATPEAGPGTPEAGGNGPGKVSREEWDALYEAHRAHVEDGDAAADTEGPVTTGKVDWKGKQPITFTRKGRVITLRAEDGSELDATIIGAQAFVENVDSHEGGRGTGLALYEALADHLAKTEPGVYYLTGKIVGDERIKALRYSWPSTIQFEDEGTAFAATRLSDIVNRNRTSRKGGRRAVDTQKKETPRAEEAKPEEKPAEPKGIQQEEAKHRLMEEEGIAKAENVNEMDDPTAAPSERPDGSTPPEGEQWAGAPSMAGAVSRELMAQGDPLTKARIQEIADEAFGGTNESGAWTWPRAFDAVEAGINLAIMRGAGGLSRYSPMEAPDAEAAKGFAAGVEKVMARIPTQTTRDLEKVANQQFSTPPPYAYLVAWAANIQPGEVFLEPSAGTGNIATWADLAGAKVHLNEIGELRNRLLAYAFPGAEVTRKDASKLRSVLPDLRPDVVVMNPPFSNDARTGAKDTMVGANHIEQALRMLKPGGRLVAIVGGGINPKGRAKGGMGFNSATYGPWFDKVGKDHGVLANIWVPGEIYKKMGTSFDTRVLVFRAGTPDPNWRATAINSEVADLGQLADLLEGVRDAFKPGRVSEETGSPELNSAGPELPGGPREEGGRPGPDELPPQQPDDRGAGRREPGEPAQPAGGQRPGVGRRKPRTAQPEGGLREGAEAVGEDRGTPGPRNDAGAPEQVEKPGGGRSASPGGTRVSDGRVEEDWSNLSAEEAERRLLAELLGEEPEAAPAPKATPEAIEQEMKGEDASDPSSGKTVEEMVPMGTLTEDQKAGVLARVIARLDRRLNRKPGVLVSIYDNLDAPRPTTARPSSALFDMMTKRRLIDERGFVKRLRGLYRIVHVPEGSVTGMVGRLIVEPSVSGTKIAEAERFRRLAQEWADGQDEDSNPELYRAIDRFDTAMERSADLAEDHSPMSALYATAAYDAAVGITRAINNLYKAYEDATYQEDTPPPPPPPSDKNPMADAMKDFLKAFEPKQGPNGERYVNAGIEITPEQVKAAVRLVMTAIEQGAKTFREAVEKLRDYAGIFTAQMKETLHRAWDTLSARKFKGVAERGAATFDEVLKPKEAQKLTLGDGTFTPYSPERVVVEGSVKHPAELVQTSSMAAARLHEPKITANDLKIDRKLITSGAISDAQLEGIVMAINALEQPVVATGGDGQDMEIGGGFLIGDGTGVGKTRQILGVLTHYMNSGHKKAVVISAKNKLLDDLRGDAKELGLEPASIFAKGPLKAPIKQDGGIAYLTYATVMRQGESPDGLKEKIVPGSSPDDRALSQYPRLLRLVEWLGRDFDGVIVLDEAHLAGNAVEVGAQRNASRAFSGAKQKASNTGAGALALQRALPNAKFVYASATIATEPHQIGLLERVGAWGPKAAFRNFTNFVNTVRANGIAAMEMVARGLKQSGRYIARSISMAGVTYQTLEHGLDQDQIEMTDKVAEAWRVVIENWNHYMEKTGADQNTAARKNANSMLYGALQRFYQTYLTGLMMPSVIKGIREDLATGRSVVIQMVQTNAAYEARKIAEKQRNLDSDELSEDESALEDVDTTPRGVIMELVEKAFPTQLYEATVVGTKDDGSPRIMMMPAVDENGVAIEDPDAVAARDALLTELANLVVPDAAINQFYSVFGGDSVAEVTGRKTRLENGKAVAVGNGEADFREGQKRILLFSNAGGTGSSYHADRRFKNQDQRVHYLLQAGWEANKAIQGLGRTNRSNQTSSPIVRLVTTNLRSHKRFIATIARRIEQLGALTQGDRESGGGNVFSAMDNLESPEAVAALHNYLEMVRFGLGGGIGAEEFQALSGISLSDDTGNSRVTSVQMKTFLNRLMVFPVEVQNALFDAFYDEFERVVAAAIENGTLDQGTRTLQAESLKELERHTIPGVEGVDYRVILAEEKRRPYPISALLTANNLVGFYKDNDTGHAFGVRSRESVDAESGRVRTTYTIYFPNGELRTTQDFRAVESESTPIQSMEEAQEAWDETRASMPATSLRRLHMVNGDLLKVWNELPGSGGAAEIVRAVLDSGEPVIGRVIPPALVEKTQIALGVRANGDAANLNLTPEQAARIITQTRHSVHMEGRSVRNITLGTVRHQGNKRVIVRVEDANLSAKQAMAQRYNLLMEQRASDRVMELFVPADRLSQFIRDLQADGYKIREDADLEVAAHGLGITGAGARRPGEAGFVNPDIFLFPFRVAYDIYRAGRKAFPQWLKAVREYANAKGIWEAVKKEVRDLWQAVKLKHQTRGLTDLQARSNLMDVLAGPPVTVGEFADAMRGLGTVPAFRVGDVGFKVSGGNAYVQMGESMWQPVDDPQQAQSVFQGALDAQNAADAQAFINTPPRTLLQMLMGRSMQGRAIGKNFSSRVERSTDLPTRLEQKYGQTIGWVFRAIDRWHTAVTLHESQHAQTRRGWETLGMEESRNLFKLMASERFREPNAEDAARAKKALKARVGLLVTQVKDAEGALARAEKGIEDAKKAYVEAAAAKKPQEERMQLLGAMGLANARKGAAERFLARRRAALERAAERMEKAQPRGRVLTDERLTKKGFSEQAIEVYRDTLEDYGRQIKELAQAARMAVHAVTADISLQVNDLQAQLAEATDPLVKDDLTRRIVELEDQIAAAERVADYYEELPLFEMAYVPLVRTGNVAIKWFNKDGGLEGIVTAATEREVRRKAEEALKEWPSLAAFKMTDPIKMNDDRSDFAKAPTLEDLQKAARMAGLDTKDAADLTDAYEALNLQERNARAFKVHLRHAEGLPGYEINGPQAHALYTQRAAKYKAHMIQGRVISRRIAALEEVHKQGASVNTEAVGYLKKLAQDVFNNPVSSYVVRVNQFADIAGLGLNVGFIVQQMAQKLTHEVPVLRSIWRGKPTASVEMAAFRVASAMIAERDITPEAVADLIRGAIQGDADALAKEVLGAMKVAEDEGAFIDEQTQETRNAAQGYDYGRRGKMERFTHRVHQTFFTLIRHSELHNRRQTFIAAYLLGRTLGFPAEEGFDPNREPDKIGRASGKEYQILNKHAAYVLGEKMVDWIHNKRGATNRSEILRAHGGIYGIPLKFKYFQFEYPQMISRLFEDEYQRYQKQGMTSRQAATKALVPVMQSQAILLSLGGMMGPWGLASMLDWLDWLWNDLLGPLAEGKGFKSTNAFNWRSWGWMPKVLKYGVPSLGGFNIGRSVGMGDQLAFQRGDDAKDVVVKLTGAAPGMAMQAARRGDITGVLPKGIGQAARAISQDKLHPGNGYTVPLTPGERAMMAVGIKPQSVAEAQDLAQQKKLEALNRASERKAQGITEAGRERRERGRKNQGFLRQLGR